MSTMWKIIVGGVSALLIGALIAWFIVFRSNPTETETPIGGFGTGLNQTVDVLPTENELSTGTTTNTTQNTDKNVFRVVNGPVVSAAVLQLSRPTTTVTRYVQQQNGHVFELVLDSAGAVPKAISNTTIPGVARALWAHQGEAVIMQYLDGTITKTVYLGFPPSGATTTQSVTLRFLPDGISDIVVSPNGANVAYLLKTAAGVKGFIAAADGGASRELFTLQLDEVVLAWPSQSTLIAHTKSAAGVPGIAFSIPVATGAVVPLLHADGLTINADPSYSYLIYQTNGASGQGSYARNLKTGSNTILSFEPYPERCIWGPIATSTMYCAEPISYIPSNYLDMWHAGTATIGEALLSYTFPGGKSNIIAMPGGDNGGMQSTIDSISISPDEKYLLFVRRGDRSLWGVRLND